MEVTDSESGHQKRLQRTKPAPAARNAMETETRMERAGVASWPPPATPAAPQPGCSSGVDAAGGESDRITTDACVITDLKG